MKKIFLVVLLTAVLSVLVIGCAVKSGNASEKTDPAQTESAKVEKTFTMEEVAKFDGQNGHSAYVVVDGIVYDVTDIPAWKDGIHQGKYKAGADLTDLIKNQSPHGTRVLDKLPVVGTIKK